MSRRALKSASSVKFVPVFLQRQTFAPSLSLFGGSAQMQAAIDTGRYLFLARLGIEGWAPALRREDVSVNPLSDELIFQLCWGDPM
jgi:hypothetical protein